MSRLKEIVAICNDKGGVGKTTTTISIAAALTKYHKKRVLVIDLCAQGNSSFVMGWDRLHPAGPTIYDAMKRDKDAPLKEALMPIYKSENGVYYSPSAAEMKQLAIDLTTSPEPAQTLNNILINRPVIDKTGDEKAPLTYAYEDFDYILIDCPPAQDIRTYCAMVVASSVLITATLESFSLLGIGEAMKTFNYVQQRINKELQLMGVLVCCYESNRKKSKELHEQLKENFGERLFEAKIRKCEAIKKCTDEAKDIFSFEPYSNAGLDYKKATDEFIKRSEKL